MAADPAPTAGTRFAGRLFQMAFWIPLAICTWLALIPDPPDNPVFRLGDVILHGAAFTYLSLALVFAQYRHPAVGRGQLIRSFVLMLAYGMFLELVQSIVPQRSAELKDLLVDVIGIGMGLLLANYLVTPVHAFVSRIFARF